MSYDKIIEKAKSHKLYFSESQPLKGFLRKIGVNLGRGVFYWFIELEDGTMEFDHAYSTNTGRTTYSRKSKEIAINFLNK